MGNRNSSQLAHCPGLDSWREYLLEGVSRKRARAMEVHYSRCPACESRLQGLSEETLKDVDFARLRRPSSSSIRPSVEDDRLVKRVLKATTVAWESDGPVAAEPGDSAARNRKIVQDFERNGTYVALEEIGRGGMGVVYKAFHRRLRVEVALKVLAPRFRDEPGAFERLQAEAQAQAVLGNEPGVVHINDCNTLEGQPYLQMELVRGPSLEAVLQERRLSATEAVSVLRKIALAVGKAHRHSIVHRDLKPANILMTPEGEPKVADFGIAAVIDASRQLEAGACWGTAEYMAPEQWTGDAAQIGMRTDVYALGGLLHQMLTGDPPFKNEFGLANLKARVLEDDPPSLALTRVPRAADLEAICAKCLAKSPADRYEDASELAADLARYEAKQPVLARPLSVWERAGYFVRSHRASTALSLVAAVLGCLMIDRHFKMTAAEADRVALESLNDARTKYDTGVVRAKGGDLESGVDLMVAAAESSRPHSIELSDVFHKSAAAWSERRPTHLAKLLFPKKVVDAAATRDGRCVALATLSEVHLWKGGETSRHLLLPEGFPTISRLTLSPSGAYLVGRSTGEDAHVWRVADGGPQRAVRSRSGRILGIVVDDRGDVFFIGADQPRIERHPADGGGPTFQPLDTSKSLDIPVALGGPDRRLLLLRRSGAKAEADGSRDTFFLWNLDSGRRSLDLKTIAGPNVEFAMFGDDGSQLLVSGDKGAFVVEARTGSVIRPIVEDPGISKGLIRIEAAVFHHATDIRFVDKTQNGEPARLWRVDGSVCRLERAIPWSATQRLFNGEQGSDLILSGLQESSIQLASLPPAHVAQSPAVPPNHRPLLAIAPATGVVAVLEKANFIESQAKKGSGIRLLDPSGVVPSRKIHDFPPGEYPELIAADAEGGRIAVYADGDSAILLFDTGAEGVVQFRPIVSKLPPVALLAMSPQGDALVWSSKSDHLSKTIFVKRLTGAGPVEEIHLDGVPKVVMFNRRGELLLGSEHGTVRRIRLDASEPFEEIRFGSKPLAALACSRDGSRLAAADSDGHVQIHDDGGSRPLSLPGAAKKVIALAFDPGDRFLFVMTDECRDTIQRYDLTTCEPSGPSVSIGFRPFAGAFDGERGIAYACSSICGLSFVKLDGTR